jgi:rare lipoprotein A
LLYRIKILFSIFLFSIFIVGCSSRSQYYPEYEYGSRRAPSKVVSNVSSSAAIHRATLRPYTVNGKRYYPTVVSVGWTQDGIASWYGPNFHAKKTSNGEKYNMYALTAAHKTLPMNTMVRVTNKNNGRSVVVRINDRGPFVKGRIIDLSYTAGKKIGIDATGTAPVHLEVLGFDSVISNMAKSGSRNMYEQRVLGGFGVQVGSFRRYNGAMIYKKRYDNFEGRYNAKIVKFFVGGRPLYRVWLMGFQSDEEARDFIRAWNIPGAFVIRN